ncbi:PREDICTED: protein BASIC PENTACYSTEINE1-like isoform X2 [Camelina sativa]|uniref:GAGA-binding transcriptional activator n=1 Tax=Camelina sativa TaxID=90675 RepID=A0ABM0ZCS9_CAMSA|nr:PREDICTED: protein BASIC PENTACYSTEINE1-like isoform X1 [Camelina sativa]XP_010513935.1 PREDICTED: protein BASIC PENTACYSTEINE1-like isoform X1 [Camelina sativa]XP_010513937.1 PREDICTED: protein BASIC PENTACYSTEINE1-like isoform X2 [Camelina sativa]
MDDDGFRNWGYYEPAAATFKGNLGLQLMSTIDGNTKPFLPGRESNLMIGSNGSYHPREHEASMPMNYSWINQPKDNKFFNMLPISTPNYSNVMSETSGSNSMQMRHQSVVTTSRFEETPIQPPPPREDETVQPSGKKRKMRGSITTPTAPKAKKPRKPKEESGVTNNVQQQRVKPPKKSVDVVINGVSMDISGLPVPVCTCTGTPQQCYRWGCGGWQSACCTTNISMYPLPMSTKRRGARISGRKMSQGAFKKVLEKLATEGYSFGNAIDLKSHWARHGTNKFVTIR